MTEYRFRLIVSGSFADPPTDEQLLDATDTLGEVGCDDASVGVHPAGLELEFDRGAGSLQEAIASAAREVERAGFRIVSIEMDRNAVLPVGS
jgi:hypothetical protein